MNESDKKLIEMYKTLPKKIKPPKDLWDQIDKRLTNKFSLKDSIAYFFNNFKDLILSKKYVFAYSLIGICVISFGLLFFFNVSNQNKPDTQYALAEKELQDIVLDYEKARSKIIKLIKDKKEFFSDETIVSIQTNMSLMDETIKEIKIALKNDPNNYELLASLTKVYFEETNLLFKTSNLMKNYDN